MARGGGSLHKKDWLKLGAGAALAATGLGAAGIGPMAGLFGAAAAPGAAGAAALGGAAGAGGTAAGTAGMFAAAPTLGASYLAPAALTPMFTGEALAAGAGLGSAAGLGGGTAASLMASAAAPTALEASMVSAAGGVPASSGLTAGKFAKAGLRGLNAMQQLESQKQKQLAAPLSPMQRPTNHEQEGGSFTAALGKQDAMPPVGTPEYYEWMKRKYGL